MMKTSLVAATLLSITSANAQVQQQPTGTNPQIFGYIAYSSNGIQAECSDFQGKTASAGPIALRAFSITDPDTSECALQSRSTVSTMGGIVSHRNYDLIARGDGIMDNLSCIGTNKREDITHDYATVYNGWSKTHAQYNTLNAQLISQSIQFAVDLPAHYGSTPARKNVVTATKDVNFFEVADASTLFFGRQLIINANDKQIVIFNIHGDEVKLVRDGLRLVGGVVPKHILWNFVDATKVTLNGSGTDQNSFGFPGTIFAPKAVFYFNNARITGALFAKQIVGHANDQFVQDEAGGCSVSTDGTPLMVSGQINTGGCFEGGILNIGCGVPTTPTQPGGPGQQQNPPTPDNPGQQQNPPQPQQQ